MEASCDTFDEDDPLRRQREIFINYWVIVINDKL